jgi:hypothetical protein
VGDQPDDKGEGEGGGGAPPSGGVTAEEVRAIVREALGTGPAKRRSGRGDVDEHDLDIRRQVLAAAREIAEGERAAARGKDEIQLAERIKALEEAGKPPAKDQKVPEVRPNLMRRVTRWMWGGDDDE